MRADPAPIVRELRLQINVYDRQVRSIARHDESVRRMMTVPASAHLPLWLSTAASTARSAFADWPTSAPFLGLIPRRYQSGEIDGTGRISRLGDDLQRAIPSRLEHYLADVELLLKYRQEGLDFADHRPTGATETAAVTGDAATDAQLH